MAKSPQDPTSDARLTEVECLLMHMQKTIADLDQVVIEQGKSIAKLQRELKQLASDFKQVRESTTPARRAEDEIPPHY
ncbi:MAG: SlyX family protein [Planctomycetaceae bacterium]|jgi:SlyX protein|nr:SlyX family protein [Planctomycetaceae bacterium]